MCSELQLHIKLLKILRGGGDVVQALRVGGACDEQDSSALESAEFVGSTECVFRGEERSWLRLASLANTNFCLRMKFSLLSLEA